MAKEKIIIGWQEWVSFSDLGIPAIKAKIDTGAKTSSLHAEDIEHFKKNGHNYVRFNVYPLQKNRSLTLSCEGLLVDKRHVKSSCGEIEKRPVIQTHVTMGDLTWLIEINLTKRDYMGFHLLLGREALQGHILIDPAKKFLHGGLSRRQALYRYREGSDI